MPVNPNGFAIKDTQLNLWCTQYNAVLQYCGWGNSTAAVTWDTQQDVDNAIGQWQLGSQTRYVGQVPPPPHH